MYSANFFTVVNGVFGSAQEAFNKAVKEARLEHGVEGNTGSIADKDFFVLLDVPEERDPFIFGKESAGQHWNNFWTYPDGPAACVEISGDWLKNYQQENTKNIKGFRMFAFFGHAYFKK